MPALLELHLCMEGRGHADSKVQDRVRMVVAQCTKLRRLELSGVFGSVALSQLLAQLPHLHSLSLGFAALSLHRAATASSAGAADHRTLYFSFSPRIRATVSRLAALIGDAVFALSSAYKCGPRGGTRAAAATFGAHPFSALLQLATSALTTGGTLAALLRG